MAIAKLSAKLAYILIFLTAGCNVYILSYDGSMINNLNIIPSYLEREPPSLPPRAEEEA